MCEAVLIARTGRHRQRYENHLRLVSGCIPYRLKQNIEDHTVEFVNRLEVLMISTPNRHDLVFPKGGWENDETVHEAALREALEEAGVRGVIHDQMQQGYTAVLCSHVLETALGVWEFRSKSKQNSCSLEGSCRGHMYAMEVTEELESWPEQASHERRWLSVNEAWTLCRYPWMREALAKFMRVLSDKAAGPVVENPEPSSIYCFLKPSGSNAFDSPINAWC